MGSRKPRSEGEKEKDESRARGMTRGAAFNRQFPNFSGEHGARNGECLHRAKLPTPPRPLSRPGPARPGPPPPMV